MAIQDILNKILSEPLIKNMRQYIVDGLNQVYKDATAKGDTNMEVLRARGSSGSLNDRLDGIDEKQIDTVTTLGQKANELEVRKINIPIGENDITAKLLSLILGVPSGSPINILSLPKEHSVDWTKMLNIRPQNMFDSSTIIKDSAFNFNTGLIVALNGNSVSDFIPIRTGMTITLSYGKVENFIGMYDEDKNYLGVLKGNTTGDPITIQLTNLNARYVRVNVPNAFIEKFMIVSGTIVPTSYKKPGFLLDWLLLNGSNITNESINNESFKKNNIRPDKIYGVTPPVNLFDVDTVVKNFIFDTSKEGSLTPNTVLSVSDYIPIYYGKKYIVNEGGLPSLIGLYDENYKYLGNITSARENREFVFEITHLKAKFMRININNEIMSNEQFMVLEGIALPSTYQKHEYKVSWLPKQHRGIWDSKNIHLYGDSITYWDKKYDWITGETFIVGYPSYIEKQLGATVINKGVAGETTLQICARIRSADLSTADAVVITSGTNDGGKGVPKGVVGNRGDTDFDVTTTAGALRETIRHLGVNYPKLKVFLMSPLQQKQASNKEFSDLFGAIGAIEGIPVLKMNEAVQLNVHTADELTFDGTHPNNSGYELTGPVVVSFILNN